MFSFLVLNPPWTEGSLLEVDTGPDTLVCPLGLAVSPALRPVPGTHLAGKGAGKSSPPAGRQL